MVMFDNIEVRVRNNGISLIGSRLRLELELIWSGLEKELQLG
jgi:hypothetical protein